MLLTLLGALSVGVFAACVAFIIRRFLGVNARFLIPLSAGAAMLGFTLWNDYTWFDRTVAVLPGSVVVTGTFESTNPMQPWTLVVPYVNRFSAMNLASVSANDSDPAIRRAQVFLVARFQPTFATWQAFDCAGNRRADLGGETLDARGLPDDAAWLPLAPDDPMLVAACRARAAQ